MVSKFPVLCLSFPTRPFHNWFCDPRQATRPPTHPLSGSPGSPSLFTRTRDRLDLELPSGPKQPANLGGQGSGLGALKVCESQPSEAEGKAYERQTVDGITPPEPVWRHTLSFLRLRACLSAWLCKQLSTPHCFLSSPILVCRK